MTQRTNLNHSLVYLPTPAKKTDVETPASAALDTHMVIHSDAGNISPLTSGEISGGEIEYIYRCQECFEEYFYDQPWYCDECGSEDIVLEVTQ